MSKRRKFIITSLLLSCGFVAIGLVSDSYRFFAILILSILSLILFGWSLWEGLGFNMTLAALILPPIYTAGIGIFWFLLPASILARIPIVIVFGIGIYVLLSTNNIFTVSAIKTIALLRVARGTGFVLTLLASFFAYDAIFSLRISPLLMTPVVFVLSYFLFLQGLWAVVLNMKYEPMCLLLSLVFALVISELYTCLFFWPVTVVVGSLFMTLSIYLLLGLGQAKLENRLFSSTVKDYLLVGILVFIAMLVSTRWS